MIKHICDRWGKIVDDYWDISFAGIHYADLCNECFEEFLNWMKNKPAKDYEKKIEDYEKAIHNYQQQIIDLTEKLDKTKGSRDWWYNQYTEMLKDYNALRKKVNEIMLYGGMKIV